METEIQHRHVHLLAEPGERVPCTRGEENSRHHLGLGRAESIQIVSNLRKDEAYATTLIVGLASEDEAAPEQLSQYGFNDIFKKPFDLALLGEKIKNIADAKRED